MFFQKRRSEMKENKFFQAGSSERNCIPWVQKYCWLCCIHKWHNHHFEQTEKSLLQDAERHLNHAVLYRKLRDRFEYGTSYAGNCSNLKAVPASAKHMKNFLLFYTFSPQTCFILAHYFYLSNEKWKIPFKTCNNFSQCYI